MISLQQAARMLGGDVSGRQVLAPGPNHTRADRSLSIKFDPRAPDGFTVHSFAGDDFRECRDYVRDQLGIERRNDDAPIVVVEPVQHMPSSADDAARKRAAMKRWGEARDARGTPAHEYLRRRKLDLPAEADGEALRWHAGLSAMLALFRNVRTEEPQAISRTYIGGDATKLGRAFLGPVGGAAIMLTPAADVSYGLTIAEGIETSIACMMIGLRPTWVTGSAGAIGAFPVLAGIDALRIAREPDKTGANHRAADECAARWREDGRQVRYFDPIIGDAADALEATR